MFGLVASPAVSAVASPGQPGGWEGTWTTSAQKPNDGFAPNWSLTGFANQTVRQVVRVSQGGAAIRIQFSNKYGTSPLAIAGATVGRARPGAAVDSLRPLTFNHREHAVIPPGGQLASDLAFLPVRPLEELSVTLYFARPTGPVTYHFASVSTTYRASGDHRADRDGKAFTENSASWYVLSGVQVLDPDPRRDVVVAFGDSITDGVGAEQDADNRYPDELAERVRGRFGVLNQGIGGNQVLFDTDLAGDAATKRLKADVLDQPRVRTVIILEGINDIGISDASFPGIPPRPHVTAEQLIAGHKELVRQARAKGVRVIGATLLPYKGAAYYTERGEKVRDAVNTWIRSSGLYDAVVDYDKVMADPKDADSLNPAYDSGDKLHPNGAGYRAMAAAIDLGSL
ncbi:SGNH/GDSL hydrolase family protein [Kibdelosporangium phytohabitans]|uniref:SGNH/GDSL hydrolase family protein n=1 Tax=Kibdelosporangium phytohabitans TaxID=860235 RepID=UPI0019F13B38|nr:SGNH/GDSL hydrolase family protein [Kibdelosporangium phytohabitans]MBE1465796.1 lysophospholipase L1-like esterase [Kibdelosporangium phytohabitans]